VFLTTLTIITPSTPSIHYAMHLAKTVQKQLELCRDGLLHSVSGELRAIVLNISKMKILERFISSFRANINLLMEAIHHRWLTYSFINPTTFPSGVIALPVAVVKLLSHVEYLIAMAAGSVRVYCTILGSIISNVRMVDTRGLCQEDAKPGDRSAFLPPNEFCLAF